MPRKIEKNAKSKEEALRLAAEEFGVSIEELSYTVEREIGKGILGRLLGREVIISAWITKEAQEEEQLRNAREQRRQVRERKAAESAKKTDAPKQNNKNTEIEKPPIKKEQPAAKKEQPVKKQAAVQTSADETEKQQETTTQQEQAPKKERNREVTEKSVSDAQYFAENVIHMMGLPEAKVEASNGGSAVDVEVSGERMGLLIGKRGDTLDAVQYLTSLYVNREKNSYIKVNIDTEGYRAKREETLIKLAHSLERRVLRERKPVTLEPMSPNERRIIHSALQDNDRIKTYSVGEEPNRKVVVALQD